MPKIYEIATGEKGPGNIIDETVLSEGGAITATTPAFTDSRNLDTSTNTAPTVRRFKRKTTGTPAAGIGAGVDFEVQTGAANHEVGAVIQAVTTDVTSTSEDFDLVFKLMAAGATAAEALRLTSNGILQTNKNGAISIGTYVSGQNPIGIGRNSSVGGMNLYGNQGTPSDINAEANLSNLTLKIISSLIFGWSSSNVTQNIDIGFARNTAGVTEVNNGTAGTFRDIIYRNRATGAAAPTIASAGTIAPTVAITFVSGVAAIATITAPSPISTGGGTITLIPTGIFTWTTAGNIALAGTAVVGKALTMTYDTTTTKWYPSYTA